MYPTHVADRPDAWQDTISSMDLQDMLEQVRAEIAPSVGEGAQQQKLLGNLAADFVKIALGDFGREIWGYPDGDSFESAHVMKIARPRLARPQNPR